MTRGEIEKLIDLVKYDYEHSLGFIDGVVRVSIGIRTVAVAGCLALLAAAVQTDEAILAGFALLASLAFGAQDAYHGWLYAEARERAAEMERLIDAYYRHLQGNTSEVRERQLLKRLRRHRFGAKPTLFGPLPPKSRAVQAEWRGETNPVTRLAAHIRLARLAMAGRVVLVKARPRIVYLLYPLLGLICIVMLVVLWSGSGSDEGPPRPVRVCIACPSVAAIESHRQEPPGARDLP